MKEKVSIWDLDEDLELLKEQQEEKYILKKDKKWFLNSFSKNNNWDISRERISWNKFLKNTSWVNKNLWKSGTKIETQNNWWGNEWWRKNNFWKYLLWFLLLLLLWIFLWYLFWYLNQDNQKSIINNKIDNTKWIVSDKNIEKYKNNPNNQITPIWDIDNDGEKDYIVISDNEIKDSIIDNYIFPVPIKPETNINCLDEKYTKDWYKNIIWYTEKVENYVLENSLSQVEVAIIDSWIIEHVKFKNNIHKTDLNTNKDTDWHWTSVAWVVNLINPNAKLVSIKSTNLNWKFSSVDVIKSLNDAIEKDVDIINLSFWWIHSKNKIIEWLIEKANNNWIIVVAAAWNDWLKIENFYPANYNGVLNIWSNWPNYMLSEFSNYGTNIDLLSPWECIYTTDLDNKYTKINWTSFSSPMLAWILSLYIDKYKTTDNMIDKLLETSIIKESYMIPNVEKFLWLDSAEEICSNNNLEELEKEIEQKNEEIVVIKELIKLKENIDEFNKNTNEDNLENNFNNLKNNDIFLDNDVIKKRKENDKWLKNIYNELTNLFWKKSTYLSTGKSLGIEVNDKDMSVVIPSDSEFPIKNTKIYLTRNAMQKRMEFKIYQWNNELTAENEYLWEFIIPNLTQIKEIWKRVEVTFDIEKDWKINFVAKDILFPETMIDGYLDTEKDILINSNNNLDIINNKFKEIDKKINILLK